MALRRSSIVWSVVGILLIAAAVIIRFVVLPMMTKLPTDLSQSQRYEGTMQAIDPDAFASGDLNNVLTPPIPISAIRTLTVDAADEDVAIATSSAEISTPDGSTQDDVHTFAVDRVDFSAVPLDEEQISVLVPDERRSTFEPHSGVAFSWPMNPPTDGTALYDPVTRTAQSAVFSGESELHGRAVYEYQVDAEGPITSPAALAGFQSFPPALPKATVGALVEAGIVPERYRAEVTAALPSLPDPVPVGFGSTNAVQAFVDAQFGTPLKVEQTQGMYVTVETNDRDLPVLPASIVNLWTADDEVVATADTMSKNSTLLSVLGVWLPLILGVAGVGILVFVVLRRRAN